jgi:hypothetical protein
MLKVASVNSSRSTVPAAPASVQRPTAASNPPTGTSRRDGVTSLLKR